MDVNDVNFPFARVVLPISVPSIEPPQISICGIVPKLINDESTTEEPNDVARTISTSLILYVFPSAIFILTLDVNASGLDFHANTLSVVPFTVKPPFSAVISDGEDVDARLMFASDISTSLLLMDVVVP